LDDSRGTREQEGAEGEGEGGGVGLLPTDITAYSGEEVGGGSGGVGRDGVVRGGEGARKERKWDVQRQAGVEKIRIPAERIGTPSTDYVRDVPLPSWRQAGREKGVGAREREDVSRERDVIPKRGPGSGKRLSASAAILSPDELESYLPGLPEGERTTKKAGRGEGGEGSYNTGPGPQPFPWTFKGDGSSSEMSGEGLRSHTADMEICFLGTASCLPSLTRGVSSVALRLLGRRGIYVYVYIYIYHVYIQYTYIYVYSYV